MALESSTGPPCWHCVGMQVRSLSIDKSSRLLPGTVRDVAALHHFVQWKTPHVLASECRPDEDPTVFEVCRGSPAWHRLQIGNSALACRELY